MANCAALIVLKRCSASSASAVAREGLRLGGYLKPRIVSTTGVAETACTQYSVALRGANWLLAEAWTDPRTHEYRQIIRALRREL